MLTIREREVLAQVAVRWPRQRANLFMKNMTHRGQPIRSEYDAIRCIAEKPDTVSMGAPEVRLAWHRGQLTVEGIERAFRDLCAFCKSKGTHYLNLLDQEPQQLAEVMMDGVRQNGLF